MGGRNATAAAAGVPRATRPRTGLGRTDRALEGGLEAALVIPTTSAPKRRPT